MFIENEWLGNRELMLKRLHNGYYEVLDSDDDYNRAFVGDYGECKEYIHQQYIEYEEERIG